MNVVKTINWLKKIGRIEHHSCCSTNRKKICEIKIKNFFILFYLSLFIIE